MAASRGRRPVAPPTDEVRRLRAPLVRWYRRAKRDLPWRRTTDPYAIWVSEVMLQQTTVTAVVPYWERFLSRFPDVASLAGSKEDDVLAAWTGLGYYRRARSLRQGAIAVMERYDGRVPEDEAHLLELPGIGRYTAGAIASLAFGRATPVVDGNVARVFSRLFALPGRGAPLEAALWTIAGTLVRGADPGSLNQAVMELGATICTPRSPSCAICPLARACRARREGNPESYPAAASRKKPRDVGVGVAWIERRGRVLLERRPPAGALRGVWDLPAEVCGDGETPAAAIVRALRARHGLHASAGATRAEVIHTILDKRLAIVVVEAVPGPVPRSSALRWAPIARLDGVATSAATTKIVRAVAGQKRSHVARPRPSTRSRPSSSGSSGRVSA